MAFGLLSFFHRKRRLFAGMALAVLVQSLAWGAGAAGFADVLESEGANAVHEQGCLEDLTAPAGKQDADSHCNEACHFWSQFQFASAADIVPAAVSRSVMNALTPTGVLAHRSNPPFRPPRSSLPV